MAQDSIRRDERGRPAGLRGGGGADSGVACCGNGDTLGRVSRWSAPRAVGAAAEARNG